MKRSWSPRVMVGLSALALTAPAVAQQAPSNAPVSLINEPTNPMLRGFKWRSIGPVGQGVRVDDFAVDEKNPSTYYIGYAVSGVVERTNNGTTFGPIFHRACSVFSGVFVCTHPSRFVTR